MSTTDTGSGQPDTATQDTATQDTATSPPERFGPTQACIDFLVCIEAAGVAPDLLELNRQAYGPDADCWLTPEAALVCNKSCEIAVSETSRQDPRLLECWGQGMPGMSQLFHEKDSWTVTEGKGDSICPKLVGGLAKLEPRTGTTFGMHMPWYKNGSFSSCDLAVDGSYSCSMWKGYSMEGVFESGMDVVTVDWVDPKTTCTLVMSRTYSY